MGDNCGGCPYHEFPYDAQLPIIINGVRETKTFTCENDVWHVVELLIEEIYEINDKGKEFDVAQSIKSQLPFFTCKNIVFDKEIQKDIQRYIYCNETGVPPYKGDYNDQPALWLDRYFLIKKAFAKRESKVIKDANNTKEHNDWVYS